MGRFGGRGWIKLAWFRFCFLYVQFFRHKQTHTLNGTEPEDGRQSQTHVVMVMGDEVLGSSHRDRNSPCWGRSD